MPKSEFKDIFLLSLLLLAGLLAFSFLFFAAGFSPAYTAEDELEKNANFSAPGSATLVYYYNYSGANESGYASFVFGRKTMNWKNGSGARGNCIPVLLEGSNLSTCISYDGLDGETNVRLSPPGFFFFSPWMLAISENFSWRAELRNGLTHEAISNFSAACTAVKTIMGRRACEVRVRESGAFGNNERTLWVDEKTRIVLKEEGLNYSVILVKAWFPLAQQAE